MQEKKTETIVQKNKEKVTENTRESLTKRIKEIEQRISVLEVIYIRK